MGKSICLEHRRSWVSIPPKAAHFMTALGELTCVILCRFVSLCVVLCCVVVLYCVVVLCCVVLLCL